MSDAFPDHTDHTDDTAPDGAPDDTDQAVGDDRSFAQRTLDALLFAPAGFLLTAVEDLPEMAVKGRSRLEGHVRNAHVLGQLAVTYGRQDLGQRLARLTGDREEPPAGGPPPAEPEPAPQPTGASRMPPLAPVRTSPPGDTNLAIPEYDTLSASQVVRRLDGLGSQELEAVYRHEAATRGRRTILHRAQQLLGSEDVPGR